MKLVMTLVVRDEEDILAAQLHYHRAQGVDFFLVLDHRSVDSTRNILMDYEHRGWLKWFAIDSLQRDQGRWVTALAQKAFHEHQANWVINNDADEFWWCEKETLKHYLAQTPVEYRLVHAPRTNFWAPSSPSPTADKNPEPFWKRQLQAQKRSVNFLGEPLSGKICHRGEAEIIVHHGNHSVEPMKAEDIAPSRPQNSLRILHFPLRSYEQFEQKVRNGGGSWAANPRVSVNIGKGKRFLYERFLMGQLPAFYCHWQAQNNPENRVYTPELYHFMKKLNMT